MQVMNFILNCLLPNSALQGASPETQKLLEQSLVTIIDGGCSNKSGFSSQSSGGSSGSSNLSRYCFNNMFELCRYQLPTETTSQADALEPTEQEAKLIEIKLKIASIATPILINRCK